MTRKIPTDIVSALGGLGAVGEWVHVLGKVRRGVSALWCSVTPNRRARVGQPPGAYETLWLDLSFEIKDSRGQQALLTRRQRVRFLTDDITAVRELVWGD